MYLHKWWARRLGSVFRAILLYSLVDVDTRVRDPGKQWRPIAPEELANPWTLFARDVDCGRKVVLDPFMGSGITAIKSLALNCRVVAQDLNPVAWFLVKVALGSLDLGEVRAAFAKLEQAVAGKVQQYFQTPCPTCAQAWVAAHGTTMGNLEHEICDHLQRGKALPDLARIYPIFAEVMYYFWVKELECDQCRTLIPLFKGFIFAHKRKGRSTEGYHVLCPHCGDIFIIPEQAGSTTCPTCHEQFTPQEGQVTRNGAKYRCPNPACGAAGSIVNHVRQRGKPREKLYAVQSYCPRCGSKQFTRASLFDSALAARAARDLQEALDSDLKACIPDTSIPVGFNTKQATNYGYRDWRDMFSPRQQLALGTMLRGIQQLQCSEPTRDFLLLTFSKALEYSNMLCEYHRVNNYVYNLFKTHAFHPPLTPCESNPWGAEYGFGTFRNLVAANMKFKEFNAKPYVKYVTPKAQVAKAYLTAPVIGRFGNIFEDPTANLYLLNGDSTCLPVPDAAVDVVITDPPYFDNVMYSELSEFYFAWLRLALNEKYAPFRGQHAPNAAEIIVNRGYGKDEADYLRGLTRVFAEARRALKPGGLLVFTFHHQGDAAWGSVLQSLLNAELTITATYPVLAEMSTAVPILGKVNPQCDVVTVCRVRSAQPQQIAWDDVARSVLGTVHEIKELFAQSGYAASVEDLLVIASGKALEVYSKHFPKVIDASGAVSILECLSRVRALLQSEFLPSKKGPDSGEKGDL